MGIFAGPLIPSRTAEVGLLTAMLHFKVEEENKAEDA